MNARLLAPALLAILVAQPALGEPDEYLNSPPKIIVTQGPAVLLVFDGAPAFRALPGQDLAQAMNTPFLVLKDRKSRLHWLTDGTTWFSAKDPLGPWAPAEDPPARITELAAEMPKPVPDESPTDAERPYQVPQIITTTEPAELIAFEGEPAWAPLAGEDLLVAVNTSSTVLRMEPSRNLYVLLSGRWFESSSFDGPWTFVRPDQLPAQFSAIPPDSEVGRAVRAQVAGTPEAEAAIADSKVPVTVDVQRDGVDFEATYYGSPDFEPILGTKVSYAVNSPQAVLWIGSRYYACDEGAWYTSRTPEGPWEVADEVPPEVQTIPPSCPLYNVRYVEVVEATPEVVTFSVLPGYYGSYDNYGTVIYGTGYCYPAYHTPVCYVPRPYTWGFGFAYDPWFGSWAFGSPWCSSFWSFGVSWGHAYWPYYPWGSWYGGGWGCHPYYGYGWGGGYYGGYGHGSYGHGSKGQWGQGDYAGGHHGGKGQWNHDGHGYYGPKGQRMERDDWIATRDHKPQGREGRGGRSGAGSVWNRVERGKRVGRPAPITPGTKDAPIEVADGMKSPKLEGQDPSAPSSKGAGKTWRGGPAMKPGQGKGWQAPSGKGAPAPSGKGWQAPSGKGGQLQPGAAGGKGWQSQPGKGSQSQPGRSWGSSPSGKSWGNAQRGASQSGGRSSYGGGGGARGGGRGNAGYGGGGRGGGRGGGGHGGGGRGR